MTCRGLHVDSLSLRFCGFNRDDEEDEYTLSSTRIAVEWLFSYYYFLTQCISYVFLKVWWWFYVTNKQQQCMLYKTVFASFPFSTGTVRHKLVCFLWHNHHQPPLHTNNQQTYHIFIEYLRGHFLVFWARFLHTSQDTQQCGLLCCYPCHHVFHPRRIAIIYHHHRHMSTTTTPPPSPLSFLPKTTITSPASLWNVCVCIHSICTPVCLLAISNAISHPSFSNTIYVITLY